jgi:hypothetical protein
MQLSDQTLEVLKNFSTINQNLLIKPGSEIRSLSGMKTIFAKALINDVFPKMFAIYDLNEFLGTLSLFQNPDIEFDESSMNISENGHSVEYFYCSPDIIVSPPDKDIVIQDERVSFMLEGVVFDKLLKASAVMKLKDLRISNQQLTLLNYNAGSAVGNKYVINVNMTMKDPKEVFYVKVENLKLISTDYVVKINERAITLNSVNNDLFYAVALLISA